MKMKQYIFITALVIGVFGAKAQQDPHFTQYFDNTLFVNPAYAGSKGVMNITGIHREQWIGFDGRPRSSTFSIHSPLNYESVGVGFTVVNDEAGPVKQTMMYGDFSYTLRFKDSDHKLAFGLKAGANIINVGTSTLQTTDPNDPKLLTNVTNRVNPNFGLGVYYHSSKLFAGFSIPKFVQRSYDGLSKTSLEKRHYYFIFGGVVPVNAQWKIRPSAQVKMTAGAPVSIDLSSAGIYQDKLWFGVMYRVGSAFGVFAQYQITPQFKLGMASDFGTQQIRNYNYGTFEMLASYDFVFKKQGIRSPRYF
jgi:type IX secretion system PorP/SprF family membrane protein